METHTNHKTLLIATMKPWAYNNTLQNIDGFKHMRVATSWPKTLRNTLCHTKLPLIKDRKVSDILNNIWKITIQNETLHTDTWNTNKKQTCYTPKQWRNQHIRNMSPEVVDFEIKSASLRPQNYNRSLYDLLSKDGPP